MVLSIMLLNIVGWDWVANIDQLKDNKVLGKIVFRLEPLFFVYESMAARSNCGN